MRNLVIGPEFLDVEKYLKKIVCVEGKAILTVQKKCQVKKVIEELIGYADDDSPYDCVVSDKHPKRITVSYKGL